MVDAFAVLLRRHRLRRRLTQETLAELAGVSSRSIGELERGRGRGPRPGTVERLATALRLIDADRQEFIESGRGVFWGSRIERPVVPPDHASLVPAQLPPGTSTFVGRHAELVALDGLVARSGTDRTAPVISVVTGAAGVGKTALAVHWAQLHRSLFPDGQLYVDLRGYGPSDAAMDPAEALASFLHALDVTPERIPPLLGAQTALYRSLLASSRMLVVLDNALDAGQVRPLLPGAPGCVVLITSRNRMMGLVAAEGAHPLVLDVLADGDACGLLADRLGGGRVAAEPEAARELVVLCARLPLALGIVAARAADSPELSLAALAAQLRESESMLAALGAFDDGLDIRATFSWSYRTLSAEAARLFRLLGLSPGPDVGLAAVASLAHRPVAAVRTLLAELVRVRLLDRQEPDRYLLHDLLRAYAREIAHAEESDHEVRDATLRLLDYYLHSAHAAALALDRHRPQISLTPAQPGTLPEIHSSSRDALTWLAKEHHVLVASIRLAGNGYPERAWQLAWCVTDFFYRHGLWHDWTVTQQIALNAARERDDTAGMAYSHRVLANAYTRRDQYEEARRHFISAIDLMRELGDTRGEANAHLGLGISYDRQGRHEEALQHALRALELSRTSSPVVHARALNSVGWYHVRLGNPDHALEYCQQAVVRSREIGNPAGEAASWDSLGLVHHGLRDHAEALACYRRALGILRDLDDRYDEATVLSHLGDAHLQAGDPELARRAWRDALEVLEALHHPDTESVRAKLRDR